MDIFLQARLRIVSMADGAVPAQEKCGLDALRERARRAAGKIRS
jgi:hypothetical protein